LLFYDVIEKDIRQPAACARAITLISILAGLMSYTTDNDKILALLNGLNKIMDTLDGESQFRDVGNEMRVIALRFTDRLSEAALSALLLRMDGLHALAHMVLHRIHSSKVMQKSLQPAQIQWLAKSLRPSLRQPPKTLSIRKLKDLCHYQRTYRPMDYKDPDRAPPICSACDRNF